MEAIRTTAGSRIVGLDVARGLAILGMFAVHVVDLGAFDWGEPATWGQVAEGRSSILFATLAGVSIALLSGGTTPADGLALVQARMRILIRAVLVFAIGGVLALLGSGIIVILEYYAVMFALSLPFLRWRPRRLFIAAGIWACAGPLVVEWIRWLVASAEQSLEPHLPMESALGEYLTGFYPVISWAAFMLAGLGVGRLALGSTRIALRLLLVGAALAAAFYGLGVLLAPLEPDWSWLVSIEPHTGTPLDVIGSGGFALAVIGLCLLVARLRWARIVLWPISSIGRMALTIYTAQVIAFWIIVVSTGTWPDDWGLFWWFAIVSMAVATVWRGLLGQGPLERLLATLSRRAADPAPRDALLESPVRPGEGATAPSSTTSKENLPHG